MFNKKNIPVGESFSPWLKSKERSIRPKKQEETDLPLGKFDLIIKDDSNEAEDKKQ